MRNANLSGANMESANLWNANLAGADLNGTILTDANVRGANFAGVVGLEPEQKEYLRKNDAVGVPD